VADDPPSDDYLENGVIERQDDHERRAAPGPEVEPAPTGDATLAETDQTLSDSDQTNADREQDAADRDQAASDEDLQAGVNPALYAFSRDVRRHAAREREQAAADRLHTASERDAIASARDATARARDLAGEARDRAMATLDRLNAREDTSRAVTGVEVVIRAGAVRQRAADYRAQAAAHRAQAAADRHAAAEDRDQGARDRLAEIADRELLTRRLAAAETDSLTGTRTRKAGLEDLQREIDRSQRTSCPLTIAYVDVVGLKARNDSEGHSAGDQLLIDVVACLRTHLRTYDHITRVGGDEFVCAMPNMTIADAQTRFDQIASALAAAPERSAIRRGFAELVPGDSVTRFIARADHELSEHRHSDTRA
jgi:diguanylate cyclase (GGDEF)-like protein